MPGNSPIVATRAHALVFDDDLADPVWCAEVLKCPSGRAYFAPSIRALETSDFQAGCPVGTPANDAPATATTLKSACDRALREFAGAVAGELQRLGRTPDRARAEATLIVATNQGAILLARTARDKAPIQAALDTLLLLIENAR
jgi:hypothetical protein